MKKEIKNRKKRIRMGRVYDLLLIPLYIYTAVSFILAMKGYTTKFLIAAIVILILILAIMILSFLFNKKTIEFLRRLFITLCCLTLFLASNKLQSFDTMLNHIGIAETEEVITKTDMNLYSLQSHTYFDAVVESYEEIEGKRIGFQNNNDKEASNYAIKQLHKDFNQIETQEYSNYTTMLNDLINGYIDVAIINEKSIEMLEENYGTLADFTIPLKTITHTKKEKIVSNGVDVTNEVFTVLLSGNDEIGQPADASKSDVNMLMIVDPINNKIVTASIPRDSYIPNPAYNYQNDKLTHTGNDGVKNTVKAIENAFQIDIDFYVKISFSSLIKIVDAVDGVEVDVPIYIEEQNENRSFAEDDLIRLQPGIQTLNGREALAFARHRHGYANQDLGRNAAQTQIIKGIIRSLMSAEGIHSYIEKVMNIIPDYTLTNFTKSQMQSFIKKQLDNLSEWNISSISLANGIAPGPEGYAEVASMEYPQSVYYLNLKEIKNFNALYNISKQKPHDFSQFTFSIDSLMEDYSDYQNDETIVYSSYFE